MTSTDFYPTFCDIMNIKQMKVESSGQSIYPILYGESETWKDRAIFWHFPHNRNEIEYAMGSAIREGNWKLLYSYSKKKHFLFNLKDDPKEMNDLSEEYPVKFCDLNKKLNNWIKEVNAEMPKYK